MKQTRVLQVIVVIAIIACSCCSLQASARSPCTGLQQYDVVRRISQARFETRATKPKLARCQKFVKLIQEQQGLESAGLVAVDDPIALLGKIDKIIEQRRASCTGQLIAELNSLQEFTEDCRELIELAARESRPSSVDSHEVKKSTGLPDGNTNDLLDSAAQPEEYNGKLVREINSSDQVEAQDTQLLDGHDELPPVGESSIVENKTEIEKLMLEHKKIQELLANRLAKLFGTNEELDGQKRDLERILKESQSRSAEHEAKIKSLEQTNQLSIRNNQELNEKNIDLTRKLDESLCKEAEYEVKIESFEKNNALLSSEFSQLQEQIKEQIKATEKALQVMPGNIREVELQRDADGMLGFIANEDIYGSIFFTLILAGSPAARAGLRFGDQLIQVNGRATAGVQSIQHLLDGQSHFKLLVRRSPMEQTFVLKTEQGEVGTGVSLFSTDISIREVHSNKAGARAGVLKSFNVIAINGESVLGLDVESVRCPTQEFTLTVIPNDFYKKLIGHYSAAELARIRAEMIKISADKEAGLY